MLRLPILLSYLLLQVGIALSFGVDRIKSFFQLSGQVYLMLSREFDKYWALWLVETVWQKNEWGAYLQ